METAAKGDVVGSFLVAIAPIKYVQSRFDPQAALEFLRNFWIISVISSIIYIVFVFGGQKVMEHRAPFSLRRPLIFWNGGLAVFSILGALSVVPSLLHGIYLHGLTFSMCYASIISDSQQALWGFLFILSKIIEFGDTVFIVLRKKPLLFLHWYHHITVCIYSFYVCAGVTTDIGRWFAAMNYAVHSLMYSYYALRAAGVYVPSRVALFITLAQLSQMFLGLYVNISAYNLYLQGEECGMKPHYFYFGMCIYGSYACLFLHFFIRRYVVTPSKRKTE